MVLFDKKVDKIIQWPFTLEGNTTAFIHLEWKDMSFLHKCWNIQILFSFLLYLFRTHHLQYRQFCCEPFLSLVCYNVHF